MKPDVLSDVGEGLGAVLTVGFRTPVTIAGDGLFVLVTETEGSVELAVTRTTEERCTSGDAVVSMVEV